MFDGQQHLLAERFDALNSLQKRAVHLKLCEFALEHWELFCRDIGPIHYYESVCGSRQTLDKALPVNAVCVMNSGGDIATIERRYTEPISAMQDDDLVFPQPVMLAYYAVYNGFRKMALREEVDDWLIVNQALSSIDDPSAWVHTLEAAIGKATSAD